MPDPSLDKFNDLIHSIYQAGREPEGWLKVVRSISTILDGTVISLQAHNVASAESIGIVTSEVDTDFQMAYEQYYASRNVWMPHLDSMPTGKTIHSEQFYKRSELKKTEFYNDFLKSRNFIAASAIILKRTQKSVLVLSATTRDDETDAKAKLLDRIFDLIGPHILSSFSVMQQIAVPAPASGFSSETDLAGTAVFFIDRHGRVTYMNSSADMLRKANATFSLDRKGRITLCDPQADDIFQRVLYKLAGADYRDVNGDFIIRRGSEKSLKATMAPLESQTGQNLLNCFLDDMPVALLLLTEADAPTQSKLKTFGLTRAELALALAIAQGLSPRDYAERHKISVHTVRTQLKSIYTKTDTRRQSQLVALAKSPLLRDY